MEGWNHKEKKKKTKQRKSTAGVKSSKTLEKVLRRNQQKTEGKKLSSRKYEWHRLMRREKENKGRSTENEIETEE